MQEGSEQKQSSRPRGGRRGDHSSHGPRREERSERDHPAPRAESSPKDAESAQPRRREESHFYKHIYIRTPLNEIKLTDEQKEKIHSLDDQIKEKGKPAAPVREELDTQIQTIEADISKLMSRQSTIRSQIDAIDAKKQAFFDGNAPGAKSFSEKLNRRRELAALISSKSEEKKALGDNRRSSVSRQKELLKKYGVRNLEDSQHKVEELEYSIETETLSNTQLKAKLQEIDHLKMQQSSLTGLSSIEDIIKQSQTKEDSLSEEIHNLYKERDQLNTELTAAAEQNASNHKTIDEFRAEMKKLIGDSEELHKQIDAKYKEIRHFNDEFYKTRNEYRAKMDEINRLTNERDQIYLDAERHMALIAEADKRVGEIKTRVNPNAGKIACAKALMAYLSQIVKERSAEEPHAAKQKAMNSETQQILAGIEHKGPKVKKQRKSSSAQLSHSLDAVSQFVSLNLAAPKSVEEIPDLLTKLDSIVKKYESEFVKCELQVAVKSDGKVETSIRLN